LAGARKGEWQRTLELHGMHSKAQNKAISKLTGMGEEEETTYKTHGLSTTCAEHHLDQ